MSRDAAQRLDAALRANADDLLRYLELRIDRDAAADALGEVMVAAWRQAERLPVDPIEARMWLYGVARNVLLNAQRGERRRLRLAERLRTALAAAPASAPAADAGGEVRDAVERLPEELAELVRLVHWDGLALAEAAVLLGVPASTARGRYQRARRELAAALGLAAADPPLAVVRV